MSAHAAANGDGRTLEQVRKAAGLTPIERRIFDYLSDNFGRLVSAVDLAGHVYAGYPNRGPKHASIIMASKVTDLRRKIERHGLTIDGHRGPGGGRSMFWRKG